MNGSPYYEKIYLPADPAWYEGCVGKAWVLDFEKAHKQICPKKPHATIGFWFVHQPFAHMAWHSYIVCLLHLRLVENAPLPTIRLEGATHEILVFATDPKWDLVDPHWLRYALRPANFVGQFKASTDDDAMKYCCRAIVDVCEGKLNPDTDGIRGWIDRFGDHCLLKP